MENKINIAKLLKDCPKGMELYSTIYGTVYFEGVRDTGYAVLIDVKTSCNTEVQFYLDGKFNTYYSDSEITLFPSKNVRSWEGFVPPYKFKDGDVIYTDNFVAIFSNITERGSVWYHCYYCIDTEVFKAKRDFGIGNINYGEFRFATEEEKAKLFQAIKDNGYNWNAETKTLEKLIEPRFKVGDRIQDEDGYKVKITEVNLEDECYGYESMIAKGIGGIPFKEQNKWELVPSKFDINTLIPFDKVLVRICDTAKWFGDFYLWYDDAEKEFPYNCVGGTWSDCIPFESNEHLLGTTDDCDEFYKV